MDKDTKLKLRDRALRVIAKSIADCAAAEPSDPFVAARVKAHYKSGVANTLAADGPSYGASSRVVRKKLPEGQFFSDGSNEYNATEYFNQCRP